jgi:hypothetical protein
MSQRQPFTPEVAEEICDWIADGKTLRAWCRQDGKPSYKTVYRWVDDHVEFRVAMDLARRIGAHAIAEDSREYLSQLPPRDKDGRIDPAWVSLQKARAYHDLQLLAKWHPREYGERVTQELVGKDGGPIQTQELSDFEKARRVAFLLARGMQVAADQTAQVDSPPEGSGNSNATL